VKLDEARYPLPPAVIVHQKVLIAAYENGMPFQPQIIDLGDATSRAKLVERWPLAKFSCVAG
jgi:glutathione S-transferase